MTTRTLTIAAALAATLSLGACADTSTGEVVGGVGGAALGAQFGSGTGKLVATGAGAVLGSIAGGYVERDMRRNDNTTAITGY